VTERCFVKVEFDPAPSGSRVRRAVGGFLRYIQHRDLHPTPTLEKPKPDVAGLVKYVAYRDKASSRAELFGPQGSLGTKGRKDFVDFVARSIEGSQPQLFRTRVGDLMDRRRAVSRFLISPESAQGLDLERLARTAVSRLESEMGISGLHWIAAIHRNTGHHHVHLVLAGMRADLAGGYRRVDITKPRLAAMKEAVGLEIQRQRDEQVRTSSARVPIASDAASREITTLPVLKPPVARPVLIRTLPPGPLARARVTSGGSSSESWRYSRQLSSLVMLRAVARRYQRQMQREAADEARRLRWERAV
jgi:relaxase MobL-like protein